MKRMIFGLFLALVFSVATFASVVAFMKSGEALVALSGLFLAFIALGGFAYAVEESKLGHYIGNMFTGEEESNE